MYVRLPDDYKVVTLSPARTPTSPVTPSAELTADAEYSDSPATETLSHPATEMETSSQQPPQSDVVDADMSAALSQARIVSLVKIFGFGSCVCATASVKCIWSVV